MKPSQIPPHIGVPVLVAALCAASMFLMAAAVLRGAAAADPPSEEQILRGRQLVMSRACGGCHGGLDNPSAEGWLAGAPADGPGFQIGEHRAWPRNLTPDPETGLARFSDRQVFNALRYGLRPSATPDIEVTSPIPGEGNHPAEPNYLAPVMPWYAWRHMTDEQLWDIIAYLRYGLEPVRNDVRESEVPPDSWASAFTTEKIGTYPLPPFPTANEELRDEARREEVLRGRQVVAQLDCGGCHGGGANPASQGWLAGLQSGERPPHAGPFEIEFEIGGFRTRPRNLTPDNRTGVGRFSETQLFNALRYGLRPGETADVEITSTTPGLGNYPAHPKYLAPPMPWPEWRHLSDQEIRDVVAYLKNGLKPVSNRVPDSEGPPDFWRGAFTSGIIGTYPAPPFPTARERRLE